MYLPLPFARIGVPILATLLAAALAVGCASSRPAAPPATLRVMTYNIHHGADAGGRMNLERIADVIRAQRPDIVALQEVDRGVERSGRRDLLQELVELTGLRYAAFGKNIDHQGGDYGNAILSRHPILRHANMPLGQLQPGERRGVLHAVVDVGGREIAVLATHLDVRNADERMLSVAQIADSLLPGYAAYPVVLMGDVNDVPGGAVHRRLTALLSDAWAAGDGPGNTIPVHAPDRRIDYIFHDPRFVAVSAHVPWSDASDHLPVVAELRFAR